MLRFAVVAVALVLLAARADACTFCGENVRSRPTLRMQYAQAKAVLYGQLKNPRVDPKTDEGFTDLHLTSALKDDAARGTQNVLVIRGYFPVIGDTPTGGNCGDDVPLTVGSDGSSVSSRASTWPAASARRRRTRAAISLGF